MYRAKPGRSPNYSSLYIATAYQKALGRRKYIFDINQFKESGVYI